jgi:hypothetical protein
MRYEILSETEVLDHQTGLIWQRATAENLTFSEAQAHANDTGQPWRVPTIAELVTLLDWTRASPASAFPDMTPLAFWSSSPYVGNANSAWHVDFGYGGVDDGSRSSDLAVRLVRSVL